MTRQPVGPVVLAAHSTAPGGAASRDATIGGRPPRRLRLLVLAYACEPGRGSEPGAGWGVVQALAGFADCTVLVGSEHAPAIRRWQRDHDRHGLDFIDVGERWWTPPPRRHRLTRFALYLAWLRRAHHIAREMHRRAPFDAMCHATYSTYWLPTPAIRYGVPCIWGPVGGAVITPIRLWSMLGWRGIASEMLDLVSVRACSAWPGTRRVWRSAVLPIVQNEATLRRLPPAVRARALLMNHALFTEVPPQLHSRMPRERYCLIVGALESRKGVRLALHALTFAADNVELRIAGDGPERKALESQARRLGLASRVRFLGQVRREEALDLIRRAAVVVFTGLREEGGIALAEAMLMGAPVIVLAHGGARTIAALASDPSRVALIAPAGREITAQRIGAAMTEFSNHLAVRTDPTLDGGAARQVLRTAVEQACGGVAHVES